MNKADYIALVNANLASVSGITAAEHRAVLHTTDDSIGELVYGSTIAELTSGTTVITNAGAGFTYVLYFQKVGRFISISGQFSVTQAHGSNSLLATITNSDWTGQANNFNGTALSFSGGNTVGIYINQNQLRIRESIVDGEQFAINTLIYNSLN